MKFRKRNVFDLSHEHKLTCDMGKLIPIMCEEVVPGDTFKVKTDIVLRLAPILAPIMHRIDVFTHFFFVPNRLVFDKWEDFITGGERGEDDTVAPYITAGESGFAIGSLADYLGLPTGVAGIQVSAMPFRAYDLIYNEWYRDENNIDPVTVSTAAGSDSTTSTDLLTRAWEKDYFTSALKWTQKGTAASLPIGTLGKIPVVGDDEYGIVLEGYGSTSLLKKPDGTSSTVAIGNTKTLTTNSSNVNTAFLSAGHADPAGGYPSNTNYNITHDPTKTTVFADATDISIGSATVNDLRQAFQVQRWMEKNARAGSRYVESILAHFGVRSSDARLQRPEYLGGGRSPIIISEVLQTSATSGTQPLGQMGGHGFSAQRTHQFKRFFEEHGFIIGIMSIMPRTSYSQGIRRMWSRDTRYDYYWPVFSHLGEQAILNKEIYAQAPTVDTDSDGTADNDEVFGYQNRYDEYRRRESSVHGQFRPQSQGGTLYFWTMNRVFTQLPALNPTFINSDPTTDIFAVPSEDACIVDIYHNVKAIRPIPKRGVPGLIDHD